MTYLTNLAGVSLTTTTAGTTTNGEDAKWTLGTQGIGNDGSEWLYVQANGAISQYAGVAVDGAFQAASVTTALMAEGLTFAVAQVAFADNEFGWVCTQGSGTQKVLVRGSCASGVPLYTDVSAAGFLDDSATATQSLIEGIVILTTQGSTTAQEGAGASVVMTYPRSR